MNSEERYERQGDVPYYGANGQVGWIDDYILNEELVLLAEDGGFFDEYATRPIAYRISGRSWVNNHAHVLRAMRGTTTNAWVFYNLVHRDIRPYIKGGTRSKLNQGELREIEIPLPPLPEQRRIAAILDTADEVIRQTERLIAKLKAIKAGLLHDLLTRGLDERGRLRDPVTHREQFKDSPLGRIPTEWNVEKLEPIAEQITSGSRGWAAYYSEQGPIFLRIGNLTREHINLRLDNLVHVQPPPGGEGSRTAVQEGDILISITADLGIIGVVPAGFGEAYVNQHIALVRVNPTVANRRWVGTYLAGAESAQKQFYRLNDMGAKAGINLPTTGAVMVTLPPMREQEAIVTIIDAHDARIRAEEAALAKLRQVKRGLMDDLLSGRVRVQT